VSESRELQKTVKIDTLPQPRIEF